MRPAREELSRHRKTPDLRGLRIIDSPYSPNRRKRRTTTFIHLSHVLSPNDGAFPGEPVLTVEPDPDTYTNRGVSLHPDLCKWLNEEFPKLDCLGMDWLSVASPTKDYGPEATTGSWATTPTTSSARSRTWPSRRWKTRRSGASPSARVHRMPQQGASARRQSVESGRLARSSSLRLPAARPAAPNLEHPANLGQLQAELLGADTIGEQSTSRQDNVTFR